MMTYERCYCGDPYCGSCGPAQGYYKCEHRKVQGDCDEAGCENFASDDDQPDCDPVNW